MTGLNPQRPLVTTRTGVCGVCDARTTLHYDARFDADVCDVCDAMLMIRDDEFRRAHPEHDSAIRSIWHERGDPSHARAIGLRYYHIGYWDEDDEPDGYAMPSSNEPDWSVRVGDEDGEVE